jgi:hypothetical protein
MAAPAIEAKIPKQLYVTLRHERKVEPGDCPLGFASPYEPGTSGFKKRQKTQLEWAYGRSSPQTTFTIHDLHRINVYQNPLTLDYSSDTSGEVKMYEWVDDETLPRLEAKDKDDWLKQFLPDTYCGKSRREVTDDHPMAPKILDNVPLSGYQLTKEVRRTGWNGGNVVWRILDPRGFQLEISSANLARIIDCSTITEGVIMEPCIWGRSGAANVLLPMSSDICKAAYVNTERAEKKKIPLKEVSIGDHVRIQESSKDEDIVYEYLGKFTIITGSTRNEFYPYTAFNGIHVARDNYERYVLRRVDFVGGKNQIAYEFYSTPTVYEIVQKTLVPKDKVEVCQRLNDLASSRFFEQDETHSHLSYDSRIVGFCIGKPSDFSLSLEKVDDDVDEYVRNWTMYESQFENSKVKSYFVHKDNQLYMIANNRNNIRLVPCKIDKVSINYETKVVKHSSGYYARNIEVPVTYDLDILPLDKEWFQLVLNLNGNKIPQSLYQFNDVSIND